MADRDCDGKMNINEFSIACKLVNLKLRGFEIPKQLPPSLLASLSSLSGTPTLTPTGIAPPPIVQQSPQIPQIPLQDPIQSIGNTSFYFFLKSF